MGVLRSLFILILIHQSARAQTDRYFITFKDKTGTPHAVGTPSTFLSARAVSRRVKSGVTIISSDLPVTPSYVTQIRATGAKAFFTSRWMNGVLVEATPAHITTIVSLPFVQSSVKVAPGAKLLGGRSNKTKFTDANGPSEATDTQLQTLGIDKMHADGFHGEGVMIAILDDGFQGVNTVAPFQSVFSEGRVLMTQDFITNSGSVYQFDGHGTEVFSIIAAMVPGEFTSGAYKANYLLFVTEDKNSEYRIEEYNWLFAAERADSAGADVIQSSLGYTTFDDPTMDYVDANLDGHTTVIAKAAGFARDRAMVVVVSAGNEGNKSWHYISSPADVDGIFAVGAVSSSGIRASFSSFGPSADGRIKPDVAAPGLGVAVIRPDGLGGSDSGTSMASPLVTSLVAGLIQAYPQWTPATLMQTIKLTASQAQSPDNALGYGIPSYAAVKNYIQSSQINQPVMIFPNPVQSSVNLVFKELPQGTIEVSFFDAQGKFILDMSLNFNWENNPMEIPVTALGPGFYLMKVKTSTWQTTLRFVKL